MRFTLRQIEVFLTTARLGTISQAAAELAMSQSAASNALKELETRYSTVLFDRQGKRLQLNHAGQALRGPAEAMLDQASKLEEALTAGNEMGRLSIGATLTIGNYVAVDLLARFKAQHPKVSFDLHVANTEDIARGLQNFEYDMALIEGEVVAPDLTLSRWVEDELLVFCSPTHPYAKLKKVSDKLLKSSQWILREPGSGTRQTFDRAMHGLLPELDVFLELEHTEAIKRAVESGLGLGCLSAVALAPALQRGDLVALNVPQRSFTRHFYIALHKQKFRSNLLSQWLDACEHFFDEPRAH